MKNNTIAHIDADCFYVSCERARYPELENLPVAVLGNQGACIIAASYELKKLGITVGMPIFQAKKICSEAIYLKRDFLWYGIVSRSMQRIFKEYSDEVEYYSVDESFINLGDSVKDTFSLAKKIKKQIKEELNIPVSIGMGPNKTLAKISSEYSKPNGIKCVKKNNLEEFLKQIEVSEIPGIGRQLSKKLRASNILTAFDYVQTDRNLIKSKCHKPGEELWYELQGKEVLTTRKALPARKVLARGGSLWGAYSDFDYIWGFLNRNLERISKVLLKDQINCSKLSLMLIDRDGNKHSSSVELPVESNSYYLLQSNLKKAFRKIFIKGNSYIKSFVFAGELSNGKQLSAFPLNESQRSTQIDEARAKLNAKFGPFTLRSAATAYAEEIFKDKDANYEICDIEGKFCF